MWRVYMCVCDCVCCRKVGGSAHRKDELKWVKYAEKTQIQIKNAQNAGSQYKMILTKKSDKLTSGFASSYQHDTAARLRKTFSQPISDPQQRM